MYIVWYVGLTNYYYYSYHIYNIIVLRLSLKFRRDGNHNTDMIEVLGCVGVCMCGVCRGWGVCVSFRR